MILYRVQQKDYHEGPHVYGVELVGVSCDWVPCMPADWPGEVYKDRDEFVCAFACWAKLRRYFTPTFAGDPDMQDAFCVLVWEVDPCDVVESISKTQVFVRIGAGKQTVLPWESLLNASPPVHN